MGLKDNLFMKHNCSKKMFDNKNLFIYIRFVLVIEQNY